MHSQIVNSVSDTLDFLKFSQVNDIFNIHGSLLDLIFTNYNENNNLKVSIAIDELLPVDDYHPPLLCEFIFSSNLSYIERETFVKYDFRNANTDAINEFLNNIDWNALLSGVDLESAVEIFYDYLYLAFEFFVPIKTIKTSNFPPWFTSELKNLIQAKKIAHSNYKKSGTFSDYQLFSTIRSKCK